MLDRAKDVRLWLQPLALDPASVSVVVRREASLYSLRLFTDWSCGEADGSLFRGAGRANWLIVEFSRAAIAGNGMQRWNRMFPLSDCGFPSMQIAAALRPRPRLVISTSEPIGDACKVRLGVDEIHGFSGLADYGSEGGRVYILLLRRRNLAWKVLLSLTSEAGSGDELVLLRDDHRRASVVFGHLELFGETASALG